MRKTSRFLQDLNPANNEEGYRTVGFKLGNIHKRGIDYNKFLGVMENQQQATVTKAIKRLYLAVSVIVDMILSSQITEYASSAGQQDTPSFLSLKEINRDIITDSNVAIVNSHQVNAGNWTFRIHKD